VPLRTLSTRIAVPAGFFALVSAGVLSFVLIRTQRENALEEAILGSERIGETLLLAVEHEMRINERDAVRQIVEAVGQQEGVQRIRLFNKNGRISFSSDRSEVGTLVDMRAEACVSCHSGPTPLVAAEAAPLTRTFEDPGGRTVLGTMRVIPNVDGCQGAGCHSPVREQSVLGVLDVTVSLEPAEARLAAASWKALLFSLVAVGAITGTLYAIIARSVRRPLDTVVAATRRVAAGGSGVPIPRGSAPEIGILARAFNEMVESLNSSKSRLEEWASSLEDKVAEKADELRDARFQIVQAEKLSSVGLVAAGIAHELNSPLMAIITYSHLVRKHLPPTDPAQEDLQLIEGEANRCAGIIRQLLDYARKQSQDAPTEPCQVERAIWGALDLLKVELRNGGVEVTTRIPEGLPTVEANPMQLMQVFVNLVMNALHAMPEGGALDIGVDVVPRTELGEVQLPPHGATHLLRAVVRDEGTGIPPEALSRVFDPFFTTKSVGKGSGLGLSVSLGIVRGCRGTILAASDGSHGATFTVLLPVSGPGMEGHDG
jgi:two-component system NtrC family sensor kinase